MLSQFREALIATADSLPQYVAEDSTIVSLPNLTSALYDNGVRFIDYEYDGGFYERIYKFIDFGVNTPEMLKYSMVDIEFLVDGQREALLLHMLQNRMKFVLLHALATQMAYTSEWPQPFVMSSKSKLLHIDTHRHANSDWNLAWMQESLKKMADNLVVKGEYLKMGIAAFNEKVEQLKNRIAKQETKKNTLVDFFKKRPDPDTASKMLEIREQFKAAYLAMPKNALTARTWGFEVEIADCKGVEPPFGIEKGEDGSLRSYEASDDCDCDCDDCVYHECNCDWCDNNNTDPEHCGNSSCTSAEPAEFRSKNGINRLQHAGLFKLCKELDEVYAEINDTCGVHIHVYAGDLSTEQVAHVMATYKWLDNIMGVIAERSDVGYAQVIPASYVQKALRGQGLVQDKPRAVNLTHIIRGTRGTIEFRQLAGTYDAEKITMWAWLVRGFVECAKRGMKFHDFKQVDTFNGIIEVFAKYNYFLHDESPDRLIPGGLRDNEYIKRQQHALAERS